MKYKNIIEECMNKHAEKYPKFKEHWQKAQDDEKYKIIEGINSDDSGLDYYGIIYVPGNRILWMEKINKEISLYEILDGIMKKMDKTKTIGINAIDIEKKNLIMKFKKFGFDMSSMRGTDQNGKKLVIGKLDISNNFLYLSRNLNRKNNDYNIDTLKQKLNLSFCNLITSLDSLNNSVTLNIEDKLKSRKYIKDMLNNFSKLQVIINNIEIEKETLFKEYLLFDPTTKEINDQRIIEIKKDFTEKNQLKDNNLKENNVDFFIKYILDDAKKLIFKKMIKILGVTADKLIDNKYTFNVVELEEFKSRKANHLSESVIFILDTLNIISAFLLNKNIYDLMEELIEENK